MRTACGFAIDEEYPPRLDTTSAPLDAAIFDFLHRGVHFRIRRRWLLNRASFGRSVFDKFYRTMSTATAAAATQTSALRTNFGFDVYGRVAPLCLVYLQANRWMKKRMSGRQR